MRSWELKDYEVAHKEKFAQISGQDKLNVV